METLEQIEKGQINIKQRIFSAWEKGHTKETRTGPVHVSDLSNCLRLSCFRRLDQNPEPPNEQSIKSLLVGSAVHCHIQYLLGLGSDEFESEKEIIWRSPSGIDLIAHPDMIHKRTNTIIEFKTSTSVSVLKSPYSSHLRQLKTYMALMNSRTGVLLYILLNSESPSNGEYFKEYHISCSSVERRLILDKLDKDVIELQRGFELGPSYVRHIYDDPEYINRWTGKRWMCEGYCAYKEKCAVMRSLEGSVELKVS